MPMPSSANDRLALLDVRRVYVTNEAMRAIAVQLPGDGRAGDDRATVASFLKRDLEPALQILAVGFDDLPPAPPGARGRWLLVDPAETVALFHVICDLDDRGAVEVGYVDIWITEPPE